MVITIIAVLSSLALGVLASAQDDARAAATQSRIAQVESLLSVQLEDYEVRRLPISNRELVGYVNANSVITDPVLVQVRNLRRQILMDIINTEIPRPGLTGTATSNFQAWLNQNYPNPFGGQSLANRVDNARPSATQVTGNSPGQHLYAVLANMNIDGSSGVELLGNAAIGNTVVDAWGDPLELRIWQVDNDPATEEDFDGAATLSDDPPGYEALNLTVPREIQQIRFQVVSTRLGLHN